MLARSVPKPTNYDPGFVCAATETMIYVQFDNSMSWFYDPNDITAMVIDKDPNPKDLVIGTQVLAKRPSDSSHVEGKVKEQKEENGKKAYLIDFWDGVEHWNTLEQIRILITSKPGGIEPLCLLQVVIPNLLAFHQLSA